MTTTLETVKSIFNEAFNKDRHPNDNPADTMTDLDRRIAEFQAEKAGVLRGALSKAAMGDTITFKQ